MKKIILLNPPGKKNYLRDYYCSKVSKTNFAYEPIDLLMLSGTLKDKGYNVILIDAIVDKLQPGSVIKQIQSLNPYAIVSLVGSVSWPEDKSFFKLIKKFWYTRIILTGDIILDPTKDFFKNNPWLDAVILDFTTDDIIKYLENKRPKNIVYKKGNEVYFGEIERIKGKNINIPIPDHKLFSGKKYTFPFVINYPFATVLTDYGCPFKCNFCVMASLGYKTREIKDILDELELSKKMNYKEIYFADQTFGAIRPRLIKLCEGMLTRNLNFGWQCWSRVDVIDKGILSLMKKAGCHTIMFGVESANRNTLVKNRKGYTLDEVKQTFSLCKELGIKTLATYLIGIPTENRADILKTIDFALLHDSDYASFNMLIPRVGTSFREEVIQTGAITNDFLEMDQSGTYEGINTPFLTNKEIVSLRDMAEKRFYRRPTYIWKRFKTIKRFNEFFNLIKRGSELLIRK